jgi:hypothetical protein
MVTKQKREAYYRRIYGDKKFRTENVEKGGQWYIQAVNEKNKKVGRPIKTGADAHKLLAKMYPSKFPPVEGFVAGKQRLVRADKRNITRGWKTKDWQDLGLTTAKAGREFIQAIRPAGNFLHDRDVLSKVATYFQGKKKEDIQKLLNQQSGKITSMFRRKIGDIREAEVEHRYSNFIKAYEFTTKGNISRRANGLYEYYNKLKPVVIKLIKDFFVESHKGVKFFLTTTIDLSNPIKPDANNTKDRVFRAGTEGLLRHDYVHRVDDLPLAVDRMIKKLINQVEKYTKNGSGFVIDRIQKSYLNIGTYTPKNGRKFFKLDNSFMKKKCLFIPQNNDDLCAWYCLVYKFEAKNIGKHADRMSKLKPFESKYPIDPSLFPLEVHMNSSRIEQLESLFQTNINVYVVNTNKPQDIECYIASRSAYQEHTDLLLIQNLSTNERHFALIKDYNTFRKTTKHNPHVCRNCDRAFNRKETLDNHQILCYSHRTTVVKMPTEENNILKFKAHGNKQLSPYTISWDTETYFFQKNQEKGKSSLNVSEHRPSGVFAVVHSTFEKKVIKTFYQRGHECVKRFVKEVTAFVDALNKDFFSNPAPIDMTPDDWNDYRASTHCYLCSEEFCSQQVREEYFVQNKKVNAHCQTIEDEKKRKKYRKDNMPDCPKYKVKDHCHFTGKYRGSACNECNKVMRVKRVVPAVAHNFKGYDSHFLVQAFDKDDDFKLDVIPTNTEKFLQITSTIKQDFGESIKLNFMDSMSHLNSSLDSLVKLLVDDDLVTTKEFIRSLSKDDDDFKKKWEIAKTKGVFPYEYFDSLEKYDETSMPKVEHFVSSLEHHGKKYEELSVKDRLKIKTKYNRACKTWELFGFKTLWEYHDFYLQLDVYLLNDVFQKHRKMAYEKFELDPCYYPTLPSFCWDAMLKKTKVELELFTCEKMYMVCERAKIGGISMVGSQSYSEANHPLLSTYDPKKAHKFIMYADANGLYSWAMKQLLPYKDFRWIDLKDFDLKDALENADSENGCFLDIDFKMPESLKHKFKDYPILPENILITDEMLSSHQHKIKDTLTNLKAFHETGVQKLVPNLYDKKNYVIHIKHLKLVLDICGDAVDIEKDLQINEVLAFKQKAWLEPYISMCMTERAKKGISKFEKDFWKLCSNAVYGKTMEDTRDRLYLQLLTDEEKIKEHLNDIRFNYFDIHENGLVALYKFKRQTTLNKPIYAGVTVLNLSKCLMYDLWYNKLQKQYGQKIKLLYTDTDSFVFEVETDDFARDVDIDLWDFSEYPPDHPLYSLINKKVEGKIKDETHGIPISKFIALRAKSYAFVMDDTITQQHTLTDNCPSCKDEEDEECQYSSNKCVGKGISKSILKTSLFDSYYRAKFHNFEKKNMCQTVPMYGFQSNNHTVSTVCVEKQFVSSFDDKRRWEDPNGIHQVPHGYYKLS